MEINANRKKNNQLILRLHQNIQMKNSLKVLGYLPHIQINLLHWNLNCQHRIMK